MTEKEKLEALFNLKSSFPTDDEKKEFFRAAEANSTRTLQKILEKWPDAALRWRDGCGEAVIVVACSKIKPETLEFLLKHGANIDDTGTKERRKWSALQTAAFHGYLEQLEMFLRFGAKVDNLSEYGETPLMYAVQHDKPACADLLVLAGADPEYRGKRLGKTAFDDCTNDEMREVLRAAQKKRADFLADPTNMPQPAKPEPFVPPPPPVPDPNTEKILKRIDLRFKVG